MINVKQLRDCADQMVDVCSSTGYASEATTRAVHPAFYPCEGEMSGFINAGKARLRSAYATCRFRVGNPDVANDDVGSIFGFRHSMAVASALGPALNSTYSTGMDGALTTTVTASSLFPAGAIVSDIALGVGVLIKLDYTASVVGTPTFSVETTGFSENMNETRLVNRKLSIVGLAPCPSFELFLPFAGTDWDTSFWTSRVARFKPAATIKVSGLPASPGGSISVSVVGPNHPAAVQVMGWINNA